MKYIIIIIKFLKRPFCKHEKLEYARTDLIRQDDGGFITSHIWKCKRCGKEIGGNGAK